MASQKPFQFKASLAALLLLTIGAALVVVTVSSEVIDNLTGDVHPDVGSVPAASVSSPNASTLSRHARQVAPECYTPCHQDCDQFCPPMSQRRINCLSCCSNNRGQICADGTTCGTACFNCYCPRARLPY